LCPISPPAEREKVGGSEYVLLIAFRTTDIISTFRTTRNSREGTIKNSSTTRIRGQYFFFIFALSMGKFQIDMVQLLLHFIPTGKYLIPQTLKEGDRRDSFKSLLLGILIG